MPSSVIRAHDYDAQTRCLRIIFVSGAVYDYEAVPPQVAQGLAEAGSRGRFFSLWIRDRYPYRRVSEARG
ncbi:KTSC domain-containing protein [Brevundimonas vesicularis]|uniref:KTSC domain-containing protein n=1 Tax=Brevundimonas vesicularis TaxID=41276 RepID=UPI0038D4C222